MNIRARVGALIGEIAAGLQALEKIERFLVDYEARTIAKGRTDLEQALALTQAFRHYYTCLETIFLRISQFFENDLPSHRWHQALLERMAMEVPEIRPAGIQPQTR